MSKKMWWVGIGLLVVIASVVFLIEQRSKVIRHFLDNVVYNNYNHYMPCAKWPAEEEVQQTLDTYDETIQSIHSVNPGNVGIEVDTYTCPGKADLVIWYASHADREVIETYLSDDMMFFGVPVRLQNR